MDFAEHKAVPETGRAAPWWTDHGHPLEDEVREPMQERFGFDFSQVRIHRPPSDDGEAEAYTVGDHIMVRDYRPKTPGGAALIAHELAHVVQQRREGATEPADAHAEAGAEREAGAAALAALRGEPIGRLGPAPLGVACETPEERRRRNAELLKLEYPQIAYALDPGKLDGEYRAALSRARQTGDFTAAAEKLNGFNHQDIQSRLAELSNEEVFRMHEGAVANPRVGPNANVAKLTEPGAPRASTLPPENKPAPKPAAPTAAAPNLKGPLTDAQVKALSNTDKLLAAYERAKIANAAVKEIEQMISPKALCIALLTFAGIWLVSQVTPAGWAADIALGITALFVGMVLFDAIGHLIDFTKAVNAQNEADLQLAGDHFAKAVAEIGVQVIIVLITKGAKSGPKSGGAPYKSPTPMGFADMVTKEGLVIRVPVERVPAKAFSTATVVSPALAAQAGVKGTAAMMSVSTGPPGGGSSAGSSGGGSGGSGGGKKDPKQTEAQRLEAKYADRAQTSYPPEEWARIEQLENNFPKLKGAQLRPLRRPRSGAEHVFEERMQTTQGNYSLAGYRDGVKIIEFDNITPRGWIQEIKIEQSLTKVEEIVTQLRRSRDFARDYGLRGVEYSISPPAVADAVELAVSNEKMVNVFRAK